MIVNSAVTFRSTDTVNSADMGRYGEILASRRIGKGTMISPSTRSRSPDVGSVNVRWRLDRRKRVPRPDRSSEISRSKHLEFGGRAAWIPARDRRVHRVAPLRAKG